MRMKLKLKLLTPVSFLMQSLMLIALGVGLISQSQLAATFVRTALLVLLTGNGIFSLCAYAFVRKRRKASLLATGVLSLVAAALLFGFPNLTGAILTGIMGLWIVVMVGVLQLAYGWQLRQTGEKGSLIHYLYGIVSIPVGFAVIIGAQRNSNLVYAVAGVYLIIQALMTLGEFIVELFNLDQDEINSVPLTRFRPSLLLSAFIPTRLIEAINDAVGSDKSSLILEKPFDRAQMPESLEVFIHLGKSVAMGFGHVDICFRGMVYSYGSYDDTQHRLFGLVSDGLIMVTPRDKYIPYAMTVEKKKLIGYEIALTCEQAEQVAEALHRMRENAQVWTPGPDNSDAPGLAKHEQRTTGCVYYKPLTGRFKIYNALRTNCVAMADLLVDEAGVTLLPNNGIITPGTYYTFMERQLQKPRSRVIKRTIYKQSAGEP